MKEQCVEAKELIQYFKILSQASLLIFIFLLFIGIFQSI